MRRKRSEPITILMAEDDPDDRFLAEEALEEARLANNLHFVHNGEALLDYLYRRGDYADASSAPRPGLILLDLNMPRMDGRQALREIKADPSLRRIPVVVLTTSKAEEDILRSYDMGASAYVTKPVTFESLIEVMRVLGKFWFEIVQLPGEER
jgi:CheY-like chemotaxis protein